jgi:hypothetical protein
MLILRSCKNNSFLGFIITLFEEISKMFLTTADKIFMRIDYYLFLNLKLYLIILIRKNYFSAACAAATFAIGTLNGEQLT